MVLAVPRKGVPPAISQVLTFIARRMVSITKTLAHSVDSLVRVETVGKGSCSPVKTGSASGDDCVGMGADEIYLSTQMLRQRAGALYAHTQASHPGLHTAQRTFYHFPAGTARHCAGPLRSLESNKRQLPPCRPSQLSLTPHAFDKPQG